MTLMQTLAADRVNLKPVGPLNAVPTGLGIQTVSASFVRPNNTTAYSANQLVANSVTAGSVVPLAFDVSAFFEPGVTLSISGSRVRIPGQTTSVTTGLILNLFSALPIPSVGDGAAFQASSNISSTGVSSYMGASTVNAPNVLSDGFMSIGGATPGPFTLAPGQAMIYALLQAAGAWTPTVGAQTITVDLILRP